jgi:tetratricopeptide (TPR) repeat protein
MNKIKHFFDLPRIVLISLVIFLSGCATLEPEFVDFSMPQQEKQVDKVEVNDPDYYYEKGLKALDEGSSYIEMSSPRGKLKEAAENFEMVKKLTPYWPEIYYYLGLIYEQLDYYDKAALNLKEYLNLARNISEKKKKEIVEKIAKNERLYKRLEETKEKLAYGRWEIIERIPEGRGTWSAGDMPMPPFLKKDGNYYAKNPLMEYVEDENAISRHGSTFINSILRNGWSKVEFDGRFFIAKFYNLRTREYLDTHDSYIGLSPQLAFGEIILDEHSPKVVVNMYSFPGYDFSKKEFLCREKGWVGSRRTYKFDFTSIDEATRHAESILTNIKIEDVLKLDNYTYCLGGKITYIIK